MLTFHTNGKLLLTGEYFVLDGALALGLPTQLGQKMTVRSNPWLDFIWKSHDHKNYPWFSCMFNMPKIEVEHSRDEATGKRLEQIFRAAQQLNPTFFENFPKTYVETWLEFPREWGLGSSSTLIALIAEWTGVDPYLLLEKTFGGSGYDIACATAEQPIFYQKIDGKPHSENAHFSPPFQEQLYFVYLGKKQNSREGIKRFKVQSSKVQGSRERRSFEQWIADVSVITRAVAKTNNLKDFNQLILEHEKIIATALDLSRAQDLYFSDYWGMIKSLGAWGGDFVLATSEEGETKTKKYFNEKGLEVVFKYSELIKYYFSKK